MKEKKIIFLKYSLLEEIETTQKGNVSSKQVLTLINKKEYQLEEAIIFKENIEGIPKINLVNQIKTISEIETLGYDLYMDTIIVDNCVYLIEQGFKGTLLNPAQVSKPKISKDEFKQEEKTNEQLLADLMLGLS
jgi:hypothetical protein